VAASKPEKSENSMQPALHLLLLSFFLLSTLHLNTCSSSLNSEQYCPQKTSSSCDNNIIMSGDKEQTFIMIKPDGVQRGLVGEIIKRFEQKGFKLVAMKFMWVSLFYII
jgi:hypothetical protein